MAPAGLNKDRFDNVTRRADGNCRAQNHQVIVSKYEADRLRRIPKISQA